MSIAISLITTILAFSAMSMISLHREQIIKLQTQLDNQMEIIYLLNDENISRKYIQSKIDTNIVCDFDKLDIEYRMYLLYMNDVYRNTKHKYKKCEDHLVEYYYEKHDKLFNSNKYNTCANV